jgi:SAM-dependent methyltransferase
VAETAELERWNARFAGEDYLFGTEPNAFLASQKHRLRAGQAALAIADGEGRNGVWLAEQGLEVLSIDFSPVALAKAQRLAERRGVTVKTEIADVASWAWGTERFDLVAAIFIQFATPPLRRLIFQRIRDVLRPGGLLLLQGYRPEQVEYKTGGPPQRENMYTAALLREAFDGFEILHLHEHDDRILEGTGHAGLSALIDFVARKPAATNLAGGG